jgi:hypothetical protein
MMIYTCPFQGLYDMIRYLDNFFYSELAFI